jgi:hypothetical protein
VTSDFKKEVTSGFKLEVITVGETWVRRRDNRKVVVDAMTSKIVTVTFVDELIVVDTPLKTFCKNYRKGKR